MPAMTSAAERYLGGSAPSACGSHSPSLNQIVTAKRQSPKASVSGYTGHTSWNASLGKNTTLLSTGASVVYVAAPVLPVGVTQVSYSFSSPPSKRRGVG